jgi:hypothetical protein
MKQIAAAGLGVLVVILGMAGLAQAQGEIRVQGTIQAVDCQTNAVVLSAPDGTHVFPMAPEAAVFVDSSPASFCTLQHYIGSTATVSVTAVGSQLAAGRVDVHTATTPSTPQQPYHPNGNTPQPYPNDNYPPPYPYAYPPYPYYGYPYYGYPYYPYPYYGYPYYGYPYYGYYPYYPYYPYGAFFGFGFAVGLAVSPAFHHNVVIHNGFNHNHVVVGPGIHGGFNHNHVVVGPGFQGGFNHPSGVMGPGINHGFHQGGMSAPGFHPGFHGGGRMGR